MDGVPRFFIGVAGASVVITSASGKFTDSFLGYLRSAPDFF